MKKGFTLIELLGVIILLAIISLMATPIILNVVNDAQESADMTTAQLIVSSGHNYYAASLFDEAKKMKIDNLADVYNEIEMTNKPDPGQLYVNSNDQVAMAVIINNKCYKKNFIEDIEVVGTEECDLGFVGQDEIAPTISQEVINTTINSNDWYKEDIYLQINVTDNESGVAGYKRCIGSSECNPDSTIYNVNNQIYINTESDSNYVCVIGVDNYGNESDKECIIYKLDKTAPTIEGVGDLTVQLNEQVDLSANVTYSDVLSQIDGELVINPSTVDTSTIGTKPVTYSISDKAGNIREVIRNIIVDAEAPTITFSLVDSSAINENGWAKSNFYVRATITDNSGTGIASASSCTTNSSSECEPIASFTGTTKDFYIESEGSNRACIQVTDNNNKTTKICSDTYKLDKTVPTAGTATFNGTLGSNSWYTTNVTVNVANGSDSLSGHSNTSSNISSITSNTTGTTVTITTTDLAGNTSSRNYTIKVDKDSPSLVAKSGIIEITEGDSNVVSNYFNVSYSISGGSISCTPTNTSTLTIGSQTLSCTATGGNGLTVTASKNITVKQNLPESISFAEDSWATISQLVKAGVAAENYSVGDTKEVEVSGYGTFTVRIANMSTPTECSGSDFSQTACGFVIEFVDIITTHEINNYGSTIGTNVGGYPASAMYSFVIVDIYNALPTDLKNVMIDTKVISSHGKNDSSNFISIDKLYLLSANEIWGISIANLKYETSSSYTRQLDYYSNVITTNNYSGAIKNYNGSANYWWTRSSYYNDNQSFLRVNPIGSSDTNPSPATNGVAPAFRIG